MGKLSKPQKTKKHKKLKAIDPFYKGPRKADRRAQTSNRAPGRADDDKIPSSVRQIMKLKQDAKKSRKNRKNKFMKRHGGDIIDDSELSKKEKGMTRPLKPVPVFKQRRGETRKTFFNRMERETQDVLNQARFEDKYNVEVTETTSGELKFEKRKVGEGVPEDESVSKKKKKNQKKQEKVKELKKEKLHEKIDRFEEFQDEVKFGEVALAPPTLTAKPRQMKDLKTNRPGTKSLLLKDMVAAKKAPSDPHASTSRDTGHPQRAKGKSLKRKHMSTADQRILDKERDRAIDMYRKKKKVPTATLR